MRPFGCPVTILNTLDPLGKFDGKADEGFLVGYSISSKGFRVFNSRTRIVKETLHINFLENQPKVAGSGPIWLFDIDNLTKSMNYQPVTAGNQPNPSTCIQEHFDADKAREGNVQQYVPFPLWSFGSKDPQNTDDDATFEVKEHEFEVKKPESEVHVSPSSSAKTKKHDDKTIREAKGKSPVELLTGFRNLSEEFEDFSDNSINEVNAASIPVPVVGQISTNNTNPFSADGPSNTADSPTHGKSSYVDTSRYPDDPNMPALEDITYFDDEEDIGAEADFSNLETTITASPIPTTRVHKDHLVTQIFGDLSTATQTRSMTRMVKDQGGLTQINNEDFHTCMFSCFLFQKEHKRVHQALRDPSWIEAMQEELFQFKMQKVWVLVDLPKGHTQKEGIDYKEVFAPVAKIEAIRLFLAYASFMGFMVYQIDVKSAFLYGTIEEKVYVYQPPGFKDLDDPDKVYKVVKALYGLHQAPRAWYETLANYILENGFQRGKIDQILFIKKQKGNILLVQVYVDDIIFGSTNKDLCKAFEKLMKDKFQMSSMGELTFFLGLQVKQKQDGIFISQDKYVAEILRKFGLTDEKLASTPIDTEKPLLKDPGGEDVDVHTYRSMIGSLMYLTSSRPNIMFAVCACARFQVTPKASHLHAVKRIFRYLKGKPHLGLWYPKYSPFNLVAYSDSDYAGASLDRKSTTGGCQFLGCRLISWQCKKQTVVVTSSTEAKYVAAASCCSQMLWIQNKLLDYGYNFMHTTIYIDNSDVSERFEQILNFLNASVINYALTVNLTIYVSCIKQFWSSVSVKKVNDVIRLQALIDRKKVIITEDIVREALHLDDAKSIDCLPNEEIFVELARMGYEKPSPKLTFYKAFFSAQWKFLIHTILQCMSAKRTAWNEFSSSMVSAVICLATGRKFNFSKYIFVSLLRNVDSSSKFYMYPRFLQLMIAAQVGDLTSHTTKYTSHALTQRVFANMRRVEKGFSKVNTPLFEGMLVQHQAIDDVNDVVADNVPANDVADDVIADDVTSTPPLSPHQSLKHKPSSPPQQPQPSQTITISMDLLNNLLETCTALTRRVENLEQDKIAQALDITKLTQSQEIREEEKAESEDASKQGGIIAEIDADEDVILEEVAAEVDAAKDAEVKKNADPEPAELKEVIEVVTTAKLMTEVVTAATTPITAAPSAARKRKGVMIKDPEETATPSTIVHSEPKAKDKRKGILVKRKGKEDNVVLRYQALKRKPQTEAQARKNMMVYLKNMAGFKMDFFKGMSYDDIRPIFEKYFNSNVSFLEKSKEELEEEESRALKRKTESSKEKAAKKKKLDEEVEELKKHLQIVPNDEDDVYTKAAPLALKIVEDIFASSKPKNFSDDFLLATLKAMFEKPDVEVQVWKNQRGIYGLAKVKSWRLLESCGVHIITFTTTQMILLVERRYPLTRFTLDQLLNNVRLEVKEESEVSLELLRFTYCCWYKLMLLDNAADSRLRLLEQSAAAVQIVSVVKIVSTVMYNLKDKDLQESKDLETDTQEKDKNKAKTTKPNMEWKRSKKTKLFEAESQKSKPESSATQEYPSLIDTFFVAHTVNGVFTLYEDRLIYEEMRRLEATGTYTDDEINRLARRGKQRGHIFDVGRVFSARVTAGPSRPAPESTLKSLHKKVDFMTSLFKSDSKFSDAFSQFESAGASGSGRCGDDEDSADDQEDKDEDGDGDS
nr:putative ribonuclease H-like domain-containing protein [Tanacetum cinerariifolium]